LRFLFVACFGKESDQENPKLIHPQSRRVHLSAVIVGHCAGVCAPSAFTLYPLLASSPGWLYAGVGVRSAFRYAAMKECFRCDSAALFLAFQVAFLRMGT